MEQVKNTRYPFADSYVPYSREQTMAAIRDHSDELFFKSGQLIYCERSTPLGVYFVVSGSVKISKTGSDGKEQILRIAIRNDALCFAELLANDRYRTSAQALENTVILFLPRSGFWMLVHSDPAFLEGLLQRLSVDYLDVEGKAVDLAYMPVRGRLAHALLDLAEKFGTREDGQPFVTISRSDMACYIGTAKETVNRLVSEFRDEGIVRPAGRRIFLLDREKLFRVSRIYD